MNASEMMILLFWMDEFNPSTINLFQLKTYPGEKCNSSGDATVRYHDNNNCPQTCDDCGKHEPKKECEGYLFNTIVSQPHLLHETVRLYLHL